MKHLLLIVATILIAAGCAGCLHAGESSFFSEFSLRQLVDKNKSHVGLECDGSPGGGGGGGRTSFWSSRSQKFDSNKSDSFLCRLKPGTVERFDEASLITVLKQVVEKAIKDCGAKIVDRGNPDSTSFYFAYTLGDIQGRVTVSSKTVRGEYYSLTADLHEKK